jgi:hypothetical protein
VLWSSEMTQQIHHDPLRAQDIKLACFRGPGSSKQHTPAFLGSCRASGLSSGMSRALGSILPASTGEFLFHRRRPKRVLIRDGWGVWAISIREQNRDARFENASEDGRASQNISRPGNGSKRYIITPQHHGHGKTGEVFKIDGLHLAGES